VDQGRGHTADDTLRHRALRGQVDDPRDSTHPLIRNRWAGRRNLILEETGIILLSRRDQTRTVRDQTRTEI
jgi:hypothetical protein